MLKPIHYVSCSPALAACQRLMQKFSLWLCEENVHVVDITPDNLKARMPSHIEAEWLWTFLQRIDAGQALLTHANEIASTPVNEKNALRSWILTVSRLADQFQPNPIAWPATKPVVAETAWSAFKPLMMAFYEKGFRSGLPYLFDGTPVAIGGINYANFVQAFREAHRQNPNPNAHEVCVLCGGLLGQTPEVDHWIAKSAFPLLSVCADNLLPICGECNSTANKGEKDVHSAGSFDDWFHPYFRSANGKFHLDYVLPELTVKCTAIETADQPKVDNLSQLLNLADRWTREFKAEYANQQDILRGRERCRVKKAQTRHTLADVQAYVQQWQADLLPSQPHHEVHQVLCSAMLEPARLAAWHSELASVS
ncbi:hypothetical protein [Nitrosomonas oligotropha]|uniref:hypothetical protein n=1 Tax=Nitrosomonas oligotropha TaxID=42354 RepID=UPI001367E22A|nr:hypothetical protein [Nitrosomonas oligotropha]MXS83108.1 hypothetical protein [Nitrosomonas oligotropha]